MFVKHSSPKQEQVEVSKELRKCSNCGKPYMPTCGNCGCSSLCPSCKQSSTSINVDSFSKTLKEQK